MRLAGCFDAHRLDDAHREHFGFADGLSQPSLPREPRVGLETRDLAVQDPERVKRMAALWDDYVKTNNVIMPSRSFYETSEKDLPQRTPVDEGWPPLIFNKPFVPPSGGGEATNPPKPRIGSEK